jgi:hypothetical protein
MKRKNYFFHSLKTKEGYSGSPLININDGNIIGIHMGKHGHKNTGILFKKIYNHMKENCEIKINGDSNPQETLLYSNPKIIQEDELFNGYKNPKQFQLFQRGNNLIEYIK